MRVGIVGLAAAGAATYYQTGKLNIWGDLPPDSPARRGLETLRQRGKTVQVLSLAQVRH